MIKTCKIIKTLCHLPGRHIPLVAGAGDHSPLPRTVLGTAAAWRTPPCSTIITSQEYKLVSLHLEMASSSSSSSGVSTRGRGPLCSSLDTEASLELRCSLGSGSIIQLRNFSSI